MNAIELRGLTKRFGTVTALNGVDLTVPRGVIFGFLGPNGAGKTTTLRLMTGLARPTAGEVVIEGVTVGGPQRPPIGYLPDTPSFYNWMTAREFLTYIARLHTLASPPIEATLERVGLAEAGKKRIGGFSRGMKQRLGLAQALLPQPAVLLLDEPASALDPAGRRAILDIMRDLRGELTTFFSTHILDDAERACDMIGILDRGRLVIQAERDALLARYARPIFELDLAPGSEAALAALDDRLARLPGVAHTQRDGLRLRVTAHDIDAARPAILPLLSDLPVVRFELISPTLEDIFLALTNHPAGTDSASVEVGA